MMFKIDTEKDGVVTTGDYKRAIEERRLELHELKPKIERALELINEIDLLYYSLQRYVPSDVDIFTATFSEKENAFIKGEKIDDKEVL